MKYVFIIGAGNRAYELLIKPLETEKYSGMKIIGIYDKNIHRAKLLASYAPYKIPVYKNLEEAVHNESISMFLIMTPDYTHVPIIKEILKNSNAKVICEKPICISEDQVIDLLSLPQMQQKRINVLLNSRFMPINYTIKKLLDEKIIGTPLSVSYNWNIDLSHGVEYLRRWHSDITKSGGMLVHKSCHHFDLLNWWLSDVPEKVFAYGNQLFYYSKTECADYCRKCSEKCKFRMNSINKDLINNMYFQAEKYDGYIRDKCIFKNNTIYDTICLQIKYKKQELVSYTFNMYASETVWSLNIVGTKGKISIDYNLQKDSNAINIKLLTGKERKIMIQGNKLKHEGADLEIRKRLFSDSIIQPKEKILGSMKEGILASAIGIGANKSIKRGEEYEISQIINL